jgi:hypothetical protein
MRESILLVIVLDQDDGQTVIPIAKSSMLALISQLQT